MGCKWRRLSIVELAYRKAQGNCVEDILVNAVKDTKIRGTGFTVILGRSAQFTDTAQTFRFMAKQWYFISHRARVIVKFMRISASHKVAFSDK